MSKFWLVLPSVSNCCQPVLATQRCTLFLSLFRFPQHLDGGSFKEYCRTFAGCTLLLVWINHCSLPCPLPAFQVCPLGIPWPLFSFCSSWSVVCCHRQSLFGCSVKTLNLLVAVFFSNLCAFTFHWHTHNPIHTTFLIL